MINNIEIKRAKTNDVERLQAISRQTFLETFSSFNTEENMNAYVEQNLTINQLVTEIKNLHSIFYFALFDNKIIGYLKINFAPAQIELQDENALEIERIYVLKEHHGIGAGQILYNTALQTAQRANAHFIWLGVWEENKKAIQFYKKNGFVALDKHIFTLGDDEQTDIMMKLMLDE